MKIKTIVKLAAAMAGTAGAAVAVKVLANRKEEKVTEYLLDKTYAASKKISDASDNVEEIAKVAGEKVADGLQRASGTVFNAACQAEDLLARIEEARGCDYDDEDEDDFNEGDNFDAAAERLLNEILAADDESEDDDLDDEDEMDDMGEPIIHLENKKPKAAKEPKAPKETKPKAVKEPKEPKAPKETKPKAVKEPKAPKKKETKADKE